MMTSREVLEEKKTSLKADEEEQLCLEGQIQMLGLGTTGVNLIKLLGAYLGA